LDERRNLRSVTVVERQTARASVAVFCASSPGNDPRLVATASALGAELARREVRLVYGGGRVGLMGAVADGVLGAGGEVIGVIPRVLADLEVAHTGVTELLVTESMHERKATMAALADGFIALPGGFGTCEEVIEILTWNQLGIVNSPVVFLDVDGFWSGLMGFFDHAVGLGLLRERHRRMLTVTDDPGAAVDAALAESVDIAPKWAEFPPRP
jgi:hypothetical protein